MATIGMVSLGCPKNQVDAEMLLANLKNAGHKIANDPAICDAVIINTCGFIEDAKKESIENILEFAALKQDAKIKSIIVTGCLAQRYKDELKKEIPEVDVIVGIGSNKDIVEIVDKALEGQQIQAFGKRSDLNLEGERLLTTPEFFAYVKIAEGCNNGCTYCAIPQIRGAFRSRKMEDIVAEVDKLAENGVKEVVLVAQDTTQYGIDIYGEFCLPNLIEKIAQIDKIQWIRLLYCYPEKMTDQLIDTFASQPKLCNYIDLPIQHCSQSVLKRMKRAGSYQELKDLITKLRNSVSDITIRSTLIVGFPDESEQEFEELCNFVKEIEFDHLGCFAYSREEGTAAFNFPNQIDDEVKLKRAELVMNEQERIVDKKIQQKLGKTFQTIVEGFDKYAKVYFGRTYSDAPEIDTKVFFTSEKELSVGQFVDVCFDDTIGLDLLGFVTEE